jgi:drug/metabolite transporter (DMT)-like permease
VLLGCIVIVGLVLILSFNFQYKFGLFLAIVSGLGTAVFSIINSRMIKRVHAHAITLYEMIGAALTIALVLPIYREYFTPDHQLHFEATLLDWVCIAILGWVCSVYTFTEGVNLMKRISVFLLQLTLNLEPLYGMVLAIIFFKEHRDMNLNFYVGSAIILSAVIFYPFLKKRMYKTIPTSPTSDGEK